MSEFLQTGCLCSSRFLAETLLKQSSWENWVCGNFLYLKICRETPVLSFFMYLTTWACSTGTGIHFLSFIYPFLPISPFRKSSITRFSLSFSVHLEWVLDSSPVIFNLNPYYWKIIEYFFTLSFGSYREKLFIVCFITSSTYWKSGFKPFLLLNLLFFLLNKCSSLNLSSQIMFVKHLVSLKLSLRVICNLSAFLQEKWPNWIEYSSWVSSLPGDWKTYLPCLLHDTFKNTFQIDIYQFCNSSTFLASIQFELL